MGRSENRSSQEALLLVHGGFVVTVLPAVIPRGNRPELRPFVLAAHQLPAREPMLPGFCLFFLLYMETRYLHPICFSGSLPLSVTLLLLVSDLGGCK